jgi:hypothetical protein
VSAAQLVAFRDRLRRPLTFRLSYPDPITGAECTREFPVLNRPARVWLLAVLSEEDADLPLDLLSEDDAGWLWEAVADPDDDIDVTLLRRIGRRVLAEACGRPWWEAERLLTQVALNHATFDGMAADRGLPPPLDWDVERLCNWVEHRLLSAQVKKGDREAVEAKLRTPPAGAVLEEAIAEAGDWSDEAMAASFLAASGQAGGQVEAGQPRA